MISALLQTPGAVSISTSHFYSDWTFWQWVIASLALMLSQLPPLAQFLRRGRLKLDVPSKIYITHKVGNPNANTLVSLRNVGGREVRIRSIHLTFCRAKSSPFQIEAQQFDMPGTTSALLFVPFALAPQGLWTRSIAFYSELDRQTDKEFRANRMAMQAQIRERISARSDKEDKGEPVRVDEELVKPFNALFEQQFRWLPGEYVMEVVIETEPSRASFRKKYRFTLFESDTLELREHVEEFPIGGGGITFASEKTTGVWVPIAEMKE